MPDINIGLNFGIGLIVLILVVVFSTIGATWASRYQRAGPDEVLIVSGRKHRTRDLQGNPIEVGFRVVRNGGTFVLPVVEQSQRMSLHVISTEVATHNAISKEGVPLLVAGTALFKVGSDDIGIMNAAERYLGRPRDDLERDVRAVLEGHLRGVCGQLTPEEIYQDRQALQAQIAEQAQAELGQMGISLDTLTLREISDEVGYLDALGRKRTAEVKRDARIGEANADREASVAEANARQQSERARAEADTSVAEAERILARLRAEQRRRELEAEVVAIAEADKQRRILEAEAARQESILRAEAGKQELILRAEADASGTLQRAEADSRAVVLQAEADAQGILDRGEAEAKATGARLLAEATGLAERANALKQYSDEAIRVQLSTDLIQRLPEIVTAAASPIGHVKEIKLVSFGGGEGNGGNGGSPTGQLFGLTPQALAATDEALKNTVGVSLVDLIGLVRSGQLPGGDAREGA